MPKIPFRDRQEVQDDVLRWTLDKRSASEITSFLQDKYGKAYRKQNILEDMRIYQKRQLDNEKVKKSIPIKYRKDFQDIREHILFYLTSTISTPESGTFIQVKGYYKDTVNVGIDKLRKRMQISHKTDTIYLKMTVIIGKKEELLSHLFMAREVEAVMLWSIIPTENTAMVLSTINRNFNHTENIIPWYADLQQVGHTSKVASFKKMVRKVFL